ncbi:MAG: Brp/Blh family beta-carotene 15,15'-dioxygenase [Pseudomonadota bacterium]
MTYPRIWQTWFFAFSVLIAVLMTFVMQPRLYTQLLFLVPTIAILGLPHGALDLPIAQALWPLNGWRGNMRFELLYVGLTVLVIGFWILLPGPALFAFLIYSAFHFSGDWDDTTTLLRWTGGVATVGAPALFRQTEVSDLFAFLAPAATADTAAMVLAYAGGTAACCYSAILASQPASRTRAAVEQAIIWFAAACLAPLVYFILYFCALHSLRHLTDALHSVENTRKALRTATLLSIVVIVAAIIGFAVLQKAETFVLEQSIMQIVFVGLAGLTVPHMLLIDRFQRHKHR